MVSKIVCVFPKVYAKQSIGVQKEFFFVLIWINKFNNNNNKHLFHPYLILLNLYFCVNFIIFTVY